MESHIFFNKNNNLNNIHYYLLENKNKIQCHSFELVKNEKVFFDVLLETISSWTDQFESTNGEIARILPYFGAHTPSVLEQSIFGTKCTCSLKVVLVTPFVIRHQILRCFFECVMILNK